ncbi:site-2 protease family protein [Streptomyces sp. NPDC048506]|uniref:site-2 protease family protein n=1 Tax=Streptomyces sp. NPDC048506 TaxID=3155028 RepID=UPI00341C62F9
MTATTTARSEKRGISPLFLAFVAIMLVSGWAVWSRTLAANTGFAVFLFVVSGWVVSLCLHEYAHARTALHSGDLTVEAKGYLQLNPLAYSHALLSIVLPVLFVIMGGIGLPGGAVFIERHRIRGRWRHSLISAAGPLVNLVCVVGLLLPLGLGWLDTAPVEFQAALAFLGFLEVTATLLNLLPVPGLDGYGIVEPWLPPGLRRQVAPFAPFGLLAVFGLLWVPEVNRVFFDVIYGLIRALGTPPELAAIGDSLFRFWQ